MSEALNGLASQMPIQRFLSDYLDRSGFLDHYGWSEMACQILTQEVRDLMDKGLIKVESDPAVKAMVINGCSRLTASFRVPLEPKLLRHGVRGRMAIPALVEEMEFLNNTRWCLNSTMIAMLSNATASHIVEMIGKVPDFLVAADEVGSQEFYAPVFYDRVYRSYHEGIFSPTGSKMVRACLDFGRSFTYTIKETRKILAMCGIDYRTSKARLADWESWVRTEADFDTLRKHLFYLEVLETGHSACAAGVDIRTSGQLLGGIAAKDRALMLDTNLGVEDDRDCRVTISRRVQIPEIGEPWTSFLKSKAAAKPVITRLFYGQAAKAGAEGMMWTDPSTAPIGWLSPFGVVREEVALRGRSKWNDDYREIIDSLGPKTAFGLLRQVSEQYNSSFWRSYPAVLELRQKFSKAFDYAKENGMEVVFHLPHGATYSHHKWEIDPKGSKWRFRHKADYLAEQGWQHGIDITLQGMIDVAGGHSLFVRIVHALDAWFKNRVLLKAKKVQTRMGITPVGAGSIHDCWIGPMWMIPCWHGIVRSVLHEAVEEVPKAINAFLVAYGQEPVRDWTEGEREMAHKAISKNKAFLSLD